MKPTYMKPYVHIWKGTPAQCAAVLALPEATTVIEGYAHRLLGQCTWQFDNGDSAPQDWRELQLGRRSRWMSREEWLDRNDPKRIKELARERKNAPRPTVE